MCGLPASGSSKAVAVALLDIPDQGGYYVMEGEANAGSVKQFLADYKAGGKLTRKQLS